MIHLQDFKPTGDIRKDYMAFSEIFNCKNPRIEIINGIHNFISKKGSTPRTNLSIDDLSTMNEDELKNIQTEIIVYGLENRLNFNDVIALAHSIYHCAFQFISLRYFKK